MVDKENKDKNWQDQAEVEEKLIAGMTAAERHQLMLRVRLTPEQHERFERGLQGMVDNLNKNVQKEESELP